MTGPDVYGPDEAAKVLGVKEARFRVLARRPDFPTPTELKIGRVRHGIDVRAYAPVSYTHRTVPTNREV